MPAAAESTIVFFPRFTTLVGGPSFVTQPLDVSQFASAQFQVWVGGSSEATTDGTAMFDLVLEESLDAEIWNPGPGPAKTYVCKYNKPRLFSVGFRFRWFRLRVQPLEGQSSVGIVTMWAEGILR